MRIVEKIKAKQDKIHDGAPVTIAFLGDSVTQGCFECYLTSPTTLQTVFETKNSFSAKLKDMLNLLYPKVQFNVINSGISGETATQGLKRLDRDIFCFNPDLVVVGFALNDSNQGEDKVLEYKNNLNQIVKKILDKGIECILLTPNMMCTNTSCHLHEDLLIDYSKRFTAIQNEGVLDKFVDALKEVAKENNVPVCDIYSKWKTLYNSGVDVTELLSNKLNHPIREFHYYTAIKLLETIID